MSIIQVDLDKQIKPMKPMHGGGQPPMPGVMERFFHYITEAGIPYSRLHNVGGAFGSNRFVDVPNIFRDFDADENDPANYDFTFTDILMSHLANSGVEPYFRLGVSFEDHAKIKPNGAVLPKGYEKWTLENESRMKAYRTVPPKDYASGHESASISSCTTRKAGQTAVIIRFVTGKFGMSRMIRMA